MSAFKSNFNLIQLLSCFIFLGIISSLMIPFLQHQRELSRSVSCRRNLSKIGEAIQVHFDTKRRFPAALNLGLNSDKSQWIQQEFVYEPTKVGTTTVGNIDLPNDGPCWSWITQISRYSEKPSIEYAIATSTIPSDDCWPWSDSHNHHAIYQQRPALFRCPTDQRRNLVTRYSVNSTRQQSSPLTSYLGVSGRHQFKELAGKAETEGQNGTFYVNSGRRMRDFVDGTSNTVIVGERPPGNNRNYGDLWAGIGDYPHFGTADVTLSVHERVRPDAEPDFYRPGSLEDPSDQHRYHFWSLHPRGGNWLMADGSTRFLVYIVDGPESDATTDRELTVLEAMASVADGCNCGEFFCH